jgi:serine/threonine protein phosphatase 1
MADGRTFVIGDVHGCLTALNALLKVIDPQPSDIIVPLGDLIDRGPDSNGVVARLLQLSRHCSVQPVLGNHEEMMLAVLDGRMPPHDWLQFGGVATLDSYGFDGDLDIIPVEHVKFIRGFRDLIEMDTHFFTHASYEPQLPLHRQPTHTLRWHHLHLAVPGPHVSGKTAIVGHTADVDGEVFDVGHLICIDTYCYGGQWLTALQIETGETIQTNEAGEVRRR